MVIFGLLLTVTPFSSVLHFISYTTSLYSSDQLYLIIPNYQIMANRL